MANNKDELLPERKKELTAKQRDFCYLYVADELPLVSIADKLGVHRNTLQKWVKQNEVKEFIHEIRNQNVVMTLDNKRSKLIDIINSDSYDEVINVKTGAIVKLKPRTVDRISAIKLLAQLDGQMSGTTGDTNTIIMIGGKEDIQNITPTRITSKQVFEWGIEDGEE